jgi:hypothetical protein
MQTTLEVWLFVDFVQVLNSDERLEAICLNKSQFQWSFLKGSNVERFTLMNTLKYQYQVYAYV